MEEKEELYFRVQNMRLGFNRKVRAGHLEN
jgi:hypothetical protein